VAPLLELLLAVDDGTVIDERLGGVSQAPLGHELAGAREHVGECRRDLQRMLAGEDKLLVPQRLCDRYVLPDGTGGFLDWQLMVRGNYTTTSPT
jgi:hypothetical protein